MSKVWFITGTSKGFGRISAEAALERGDRVAAPLRIFFGANPLDVAREEYARRIETWERWDDLSKRAHGTPERNAA